MSEASAVTLQAKRKQGRSPAYPGIDLKVAIEKAKALHEAEGKYAAPMPSAFAAWGFGAKSSGGREVRAALKYFGLITVEGDGEMGKVKLTDEALRVLIDEREDQTEKNSLLRKLALTPAIHKILFEKFSEGIKSDASVAHFLIFEQHFNQSAASELVAEFKATAEFTGLYKPDKVVDKSDPLKPEREESVAIGDLVQVEVNGVIPFGPKRVRAIHDGWVFVEDSETGATMDQVQMIEKAATPPPPPPIGGRGEPPRLPLTPAADALPPEWREERLLDETGEEIFVRYKGEPSKERYEFIRDYLDFKLKRMK